MRTLTDIALEQEWLEKSFKYIRRFWKNGRWNYVYEEPNGTVSYNRPVYRQFVGKASAAIKHLFARKRGQALDVAEIMLPAIDVDENGEPFEVVQTDGSQHLVPTSIDLIWGSKSKGLFHLLLRHFVQQNDFKTIQAAEDFVVDSLKEMKNNPQNFTVTFDRNRGSYHITDRHGNSFIVGTEFSQDSNGKGLVRHFVMTSYDYRSPDYKQNSKAEMNKRYIQVTKQRAY